MPEGPGDQNDMLEVTQAAERAGAVVAEQIKSIMAAAQAKAEDLQRGAERDARDQRRQSERAVVALAERLEAIDGHLSGLVDELRREALRLRAALEREGG